MKNIRSGLIWLLVALVGAFAFAMLALSRGEHVNAVWLVVAAVACYSIAYRFYSRFIADKVFELDDRRLTPAERHNDGLDYVPTNKWVLFGHHFAAIAGAGPLVGPILAAQMGFLPGTIWILVGVMLAGAVQDFLVLFISTRRDGRSLGEMAKQELGAFAGVITMLGAAGGDDHHPVGVGAGGGKSAGRQPVGAVHHRRHHPDCPVHGHLYALYSAGQDR